jgi:RNA polymerase sigma-70 factor, ECF subfamily
LAVAVPTVGRAGAPAPAPEVAASRLYELYYDRICGYCLYHLGSREEAEDAAQTTFLNALRGLRRGVVPEVELHWLIAIAKNACLVRHRSRGRRTKMEVLRDPHVLQDAFCGPEAVVDDLLPLPDALERMPEQQRRAILLREWKGLSYREIASEMDLSVGAVETLIFRARRSLAQLLEGEPEAGSRRLKHAFDFGSLAAALKSALAGGSGVKAAATAAALASVVLIAAPIVSRDAARSAPATLAPAAAVSASTEREVQVSGRSAAAAAQARATEHRVRSRPASQGQPVRPGHTGDMEEQTQPASTVDDLARTGTGAVDELTDTASSGVEDLEQELPVLPGVPPVELQLP